jgi:hypothetical protein
MWADPQRLAFAIAFALTASIAVIWWVPKWQVARSQNLTPKNRFDRENEARKTLAQIVGGIFVLAGLYSSIENFRLQTRTFDLQREGQVTDRYTKAIEQLGAVLGNTMDKSGQPMPNLTVRLGGIYALERISMDWPEHRATIMEVLSAYVRQNAAINQPPGEGECCLSQGAKVAMTPERENGPRADIQAILTVIGRRAYDPDRPFERIDLSKTYLERAHLEWARLDGAYLIRADLREAVLEDADLSGVLLAVADLRGAYLNRAHLDRADLRGASLHRTNLGGASLLYADLREADLTSADLRGADLRRAIVSQDQLDSAMGDSHTILPEESGLHRPASWW